MRRGRSGRAALGAVGHRDRLLREYADAELVGVYATHESHLLADNGDAEDVAAIEAVVYIQTARETGEELAA